MKLNYKKYKLYNSTHVSSVPKSIFALRILTQKEEMRKLQNEQDFVYQCLTDNRGYFQNPTL